MTGYIKWSDPEHGTTEDGFKVELWDGKNADEVVFKIMCPAGLAPSAIISSGKSRVKAIEMIVRFIGEARERL